MDPLPVALPLLLLLLPPPLPLSAAVAAEPAFAGRTHEGRLDSGSPPETEETAGRLSSEPSARRHWPVHRISECVFVTSEEKLYFYTAESDSEQVCGVYLFTDPDKVIEVHFRYLDVPCGRGGLVTFFDGWELNGEFFPGAEEDKTAFGRRYHEFCGFDKPERVLVTSQNAGMLHYRVPAGGRGFGFYAKFSKTPTPCDVLVEDREGVYTLRNHGRNRNCSLIAVFPAEVNILALDLGVSGEASQADAALRCEEAGMRDGLQIGGSEGLDPSRFVPFREYCGLDSARGAGRVVVGCGVTVVRLLSSGRRDNSATFSIGQTDESLAESPFGCRE